VAVPFRRVSKTRKNMRRTHYKITPNEMTKCSNCGEMIKPHRVCPKCGYYKGKSVVEKDEEEKSE
jgi:large subunit ribosomal protein L32